MAKLRINGDSSGYVDLEAPNAASSSTLDLDQVPQKNAANTFSAVNKFTDSVAIGGTHSPVNNLDVRSTGQAIVRVDGVGLYYNGIKIRNNYSSVQSDWNVGAAGGTSGWGSANGTFIVRDDTTNSTGLEIEQGAGSNTAALHINSSGYVTTPNQPAFEVNITTNTSVPTSTAKINFNNINVNTGNHYDGTNDRFVAPVTGKYFISWCVNAYSGNVESRYLAARLYKNGSSYRVAHGQMAAASGSSDYGLAPGSIVVHLNVNDYLEVHVDAAAGGLTMSANNTNFTGFLIG